MILHLPVNSATTFAVRTLLREAANKSNHGYRGNINKRNVRYVSRAALPYLDQPGPVVAEHMIPISVMLSTKIYVDHGAARETGDLVELVAAYSGMALITKAEDKKLRIEKLQKRMPIGWDGNNPFARYEAVGIVVVPVPRR